MQLTGPFFLFLFLPLSLPPVLLAPPRHRRTVLSLLSAVWYFFLALSNPLTLLCVALLLLFVVGLSRLPWDFRPRLVLALGISVPAAFLLAALFLSEYVAGYQFPVGLVMITLSTLSYFIDRYRGDAPEKESPLSVVGYLLFFPTLTLGPIIRYKHFLNMMESPRPGLECMAKGTRLYMFGFFKQMALAFVLMRTIGDLITFAEGALHPTVFVLILLLALLNFYFFVTGSMDMARGICMLYGLYPPRARAAVLTAPSPDRMFYNIHLSLVRYWNDYLIRPLTGVLGKRAAYPLGTVLAFLFTVFFWRAEPVMLLIALPIFLSSLITLHTGRFYMIKPKRKSMLLRLFGIAVSFFTCAFFALALCLEHPADVFRLFFAVSTAPTFHPVYLFAAVPDTNHLFWGALLLSPFVPLAHFYPHILRRLTGGRRTAFLAFVTALIVAGFTVSLVYFLPQFPQLEHLDYRSFFVRCAA